ncbi:Unknown protein sequence [Pseudomonas syringae pv. spinaceae]|uniref:Uncharacterized protein n=1 Tax=Pseudomonas syringae pv. spinaceae TaxID=264459 RepID=A0A0Q0ARM7_PSESX|nr:Unknown protein sequence [Pseudomonas syringae pv. spinaceae]
MLEPQRTVGQASQLEVKVLVDRAAIDHVVEFHLIAYGLEVGVQQQVDPGVVEHLLEHTRVAIAGHHLESVDEITVVFIGARGDPRGHRLVQRGRVQAPLLAGVTTEEFLVERSPDLIDHHVFRRANRGHGFRALGQEHFGLLGCHRQTVQLVKRGEIDGDRHQLPINLRQHTMLIRPPLGESRQVVDDPLRVGMEDVRTVTMHQHPCCIRVIVCIAGDMRASVDQQHIAPQPLGQTLGDDAAGKPGADDQVVIDAATGLVGRSGFCGFKVYLRHSICSFIKRHVLSQDIPSSAASARFRNSGVPLRRSAPSMALTNASVVSAMNTAPLWP